MSSSRATQSSAAAPASSFRDPGGRLYVLPHRVLRVVSGDGRSNLECFLKSKTIARLAEAGQAVRTSVLPSGEADEALAQLGLPRADDSTMVCEHERMQFPSYPYEWAPEMLAEAAHLTLDLAESLLAEGMGL